MDNFNKQIQDDLIAYKEAHNNIKQEESWNALGYVLFVILTFVGLIAYLAYPSIG